MFSKNDFDFHECFLSKFIVCDQSFILKLLPTCGIFSSIDEINFIKPNILVNELDMCDCGNIFWLNQDLCYCNGCYKIHIVWETQHGIQKNLIITFLDVSIKYNDISEEKNVYNHWPRTTSTICWLTAKSNLRICQYWIQAGYFDKEIVKCLIFKSIRNAIQALYRKKGQNIIYFNDIPSKFEDDYLKTGILDQKYRCLVSEAESMDDFKVTSDNLMSFYLMCNDFVRDIKYQLEEVKD